MAISLVDYANQTDVPMRKGLVQQITNESIFLPMLKFVSVDGFTYRYNRQTTLGGIAFRGLNEGYTADQGVVNPQNENLAILGGEVQTDRQIVNKQGDIARANAIAAKVKKAGLFFDRYVIKGDPANNGKEFYGMNPRLTGNQVISIATNGGPLTLAKLDLALDQVVGTNNQKQIVCNKNVRRQISALIRAAAGGATMMEIPGQVAEYDGAKIQVLDEDGDESAILAFDETQGSSNVTSSLYVIRPGSDTDGEYVQGLIGSQMMEHVQVGLLGTYFLDIIEANLGLAVFHPRAACRVKGITSV